MVRIHSNVPKIVDQRGSEIDFDSEAAEYYPSSCCEMLHVRNAVLASTILQMTFCGILGILFIYLDNSGFLRAVDICRTSMILLFSCNVIGLVSAFLGILQEKISLIHVQTMILTTLVVISDLMALSLVLIMAIGKRNYATANIPGIFIDVDRVEYVLGPFWIYLLAIILHMTAAATMCLIGIYNRYLKYLITKTEYQKLESTTMSSKISSTISSVNNSD